MSSSKLRSVAAKLMAALVLGAPAANAAESNLANGIALSGTIEFEATAAEAFDGTDSSDLAVATVELGVDAKVDENLTGHVLLKFEQDAAELDVDEAYLTLGKADTGFSADLGQLYVPFGHFETNLVSDPLTLELAETRESAAVANFRSSIFGASIFAFNGDSQDVGDDTVEGFGARIGIASEGDDRAYALGVDYISSLADSDTLQDGTAGVANVTTLADYVGGVAVFGKYRQGKVTVIAEYVSATGNFEASELDFNGEGAEPSAFNVEVGFGTTIAGKDAMLAVGYQGTREALALGLPKTRTLAAVSVDVMKNTALSFEVARDEDYASSDTGTGAAGAVSGTGETANSYTVQLAVSF